MRVPDRTIRRALVTGATGFIGGHLVERLRQGGVFVRALARDPGRAAWLRDLGADIVHGDLADLPALCRALVEVDTVLHAAAVVGPATLSGEVYRRVNVEGTRIFARVCQEFGVERFVHVSSLAVIGPLSPEQVAAEDAPTRPADVYGATKLEGEAAALAAARGGLPVVVARPSLVYGPRSPSTLRLFRSIAHRRLLIVGRARNTQQPLWIDDLVDGLLRCALAPGAEGQVYHLAGPEILTLERLCKLVAAAAGVSVPPVRPPLWMALCAAHLCERLFHLVGREPPLDRRKVAMFRVYQAYSIGRAWRELDWRPQVSFEEGAQRTMAFFRRQGLV